MHYQTLQLDASGTSGDFVVSLTPIPPNANIYNEFYCGAQLHAGESACGTTTESVDFFGNSVAAIASPNLETQGYVRWGDFSDPNQYTSPDNGIMFKDSNGLSTHLGVSQIEGLRIQSLTLTTLGAGGP